MSFSGPVSERMAEGGEVVHMIEQWKNINALNLSGGFSTSVGRIYDIYENLVNILSKSNLDAKNPEIGLASTHTC